MNDATSPSETSLRAAITLATAAGSALADALPLPAAPRMATIAPSSDSEKPRIDARATSFSDSEKPLFATSVPSAEIDSLGFWFFISHSLAMDGNGR